MKRTSFDPSPALRLAGYAAAIVVLAATTAPAQLSAPAQGPTVEAPGSILLAPSFAVVDDDRFTDVGILVNGRYVIAEGVSVHGHLGGLFGDLDGFSFGGGVKGQFVEQRPDFPVDLSGITTLGVLVGDDSTLVTWLAGPMVGHDFRVDSVTLTPYASLGLGFAHRDFGGSLAPGRGDDDATELAMGMTFGGEVSLAGDLVLGSEITFGLADGLPDVNAGLRLTLGL